METGGEAIEYVVVFDCNVYLDAGRLLGEPFAWAKVDPVVRELDLAPVPHPEDESLDSLRALTSACAGRIGDGELRVWTSTHIDKMVRHAAARPRRPDGSSGGHGLGWSKNSAQALVEDLIHDVVNRTRGGIVDRCFPDGNPPLDHEDGMVYGLCRLLAGENLLAEVLCITRDRDFLDAYLAGKIGSHSKVITPAKFVALFRKASVRVAMSRIPRPRG